MLNIKREEIGVGEYTDSKNNIHTIKHSVICTDEEKEDIEDRVVKGLYSIFTLKGRYA